MKREACPPFATIVIQRTHTIPETEDREVLSSQITQETNLALKIGDFIVGHHIGPSTMCHQEDVFHSQCGHWGSPRVYQPCPNTNREGFSKGCWNRKSTGSVTESTICVSCQQEHETFSQQGSWLSVTQTPNKQTQITIISDGESAGHTLQETRALRKNPSGFFHRRVQC